MSIPAHFQEKSSVSLLGGEKGRAERKRLLLTAQGAFASGKAAKVVVHNISETGALLETEVELEIGEGLDLELPDAAPVYARVIWSSGHLYGCAFDSKISTSVLSQAQLRGAVPPELATIPAPKPATASAVGGESLGERLHRLRKLRGFTQGELASRLGVSKPTVWAWEQDRARPIEERLGAIAEVLGVEVADLRPSRTVPGLSDLIARCREQIASVVETSPDKVRIMIEL